MTTRSIQYLIASTLALSVAGCGGAATNNANNGNRMSNMNANSNSSVSNTIGSAANSIANAAASLTTDSPNDFMIDAAHGGMAEVENSRVALQKSKNAEIKKFAQMMVSDHTKAGEELKTLAAKKNVTLPNDLGSHKDDNDDLKEATADFDKMYVDTMVADHEDTVAAFQAQADKSTDADVKAFAAKTLPTLKSHLEMVKGIQNKMSGNMGANSNGNMNANKR
ncbi:MAG: DUF4142 domain-containing protein [Pyrinomonadaceae bacterium]